MASSSSSGPLPPAKHNGEKDEALQHVNDSTSASEQDKLIDEFVVMNKFNHWLLFALTDKGTHAFVFRTENNSLDNRATLGIHSEPYYKPVPIEDQSGPGYFALTDPAFTITRHNSRIKALFQVKAQEPLVTLGQLKKLMFDSRMHDYSYVELIPGHRMVGTEGAQFWIISLLGELQIEGRIPAGSAEALFHLIKERSDKLRLRDEAPGPPEQIPWPIIPGIFHTAKLRYTPLEMHPIEEMTLEERTAYSKSY